MEIKKSPNDRHKETRMMSVYPHVWAGRILGGHASLNFNQAIECWAFLLGPATRENEKAFNSQQWEILEEAIPLLNLGKCPVLEPTSPDPGKVLATVLRQKHAVQPLFHGKEGDLAVAMLAKRLENLDYLHAWAIVFTLQWKRREPAAAGDEWWTLASRQKSG